MTCIFLPTACLFLHNVQIGEAEANLKKLQKIEKRKKKDATMEDANVKNSIKKKRKGFKLRKNVVIKGIKIKDAQSKKDARAAINEMREKEMDVDD